MNLLILTGAVLEVLSHVHASVLVSPPLDVPHNASPPMKSYFPGFAFEEASFYDFAGSKSNPNNVSQNLVQAIAAETNTKPMIRVGGTSLDHASYHPNQKEPLLIPGGQKGGIPDNMTIGPSFFDSFANFPSAQYIVDIPFAKENLSNSLLFAKQAYATIGPANIFAFEIGNEVNNYPGHGRPPTWSEADYSTQWTNWSGSISGTLGIAEDSEMYQAVALSSETTATKFPGGTAADWKIPKIWESGLNKEKGRMKSVSMHYYQTKANEGSDLQYDLMNHTAVTRGSDFIYQAVKTLNNTGIPLILGEVGNTLGNRSSGISLEAVLGSALWQVDFSLWSMFIGVSGLDIQSGSKFPFSLWLPTTNETNGTVLPAFYGHMFSAEFIGSNRNVQVANIDLNSPHLSAYAAYEDGALSRVGIVNLHLWDRETGSEPLERPSENIILEIGENVKTVTIKKLTSVNGGSARAENITWGGQQWKYKNGGVAERVLNDTVVQDVQGGNVEVEVKSSEAVMIFLQK
ncbi:hypothetical protein BP6252_13142 [Coleophoma cylindrospora]|uniref:Beta-glucuronidase C-terminal domain-containing protein n=1 Tax=Coleophoma cylindrospora TaxID=1849047 RepID=A0A3D8QA16_9HELO|nr:hypothetical protein BP6252_13142 [Coleophoma cylindrospora]